MEQQQNYNAIIPAKIRYDDDLISGAKLLYGEITALSNRCGYCNATNRYFADLYKTTNSTIVRWIRQLVEKEYIKSVIVYHEGTKQIKERQLYAIGL